MKLTQVRIENFRSIQNIKITFDPSCRVLVGKNEVGKSNILKALSMLDESIALDKTDIIENLPHEDLVTTSDIVYTFLLESADIKQIISSQMIKTLSSNAKILLLNENEKKELTLEDYIFDYFKQCAYVIEVPEKRYGGYWKAKHELTVKSNWKRPNAKTPFKFEINDVEVSLSDYELIDIDTYPDIPLEHLRDISFEHIQQLVGSKVIDFVSNNKPQVLLWNYSDQHTLPPSIEINSFVENPEHCIALKSMFELAGINEISKTITQVLSKNRHGLRNLLDRVAKRTTEHFQSVWDEYKNIEFVLSPNGNCIDATIKDIYNNYELSQRSDGFKRFVSFLLFISAKVESDQMNNTLLLFDEPDLALHPSGQKYLREELLKISKNNYIVYSTHSIFMIDRHNIQRHLIVEKINERTTLAEADNSNFADEEVLYNALGFSVFETLKNNNIIFEGWKDKKIFSLALTKIPTKYKEIGNLKNIGYCHARGVKDVKNIANILELAGRSFVVLSDNDNPAREKQEEFMELRKSEAWKRYDELVEKVNVHTVEDFIKPRCFAKAIDKLSKEYPNFPLIKEESFRNSSKTILTTITEILASAFKNASERKKIMEQIKNEVFNNLKQSDIEETYYMMISNLNRLIDKNSRLDR